MRHLSEVVVNGGPAREIVGEYTPLAAAFQNVEDGACDLAEAVDSRLTVSLGRRHMRLEVVPFGIGKICWVGFSHAC